MEAPTLRSAERIDQTLHTIALVCIQLRAICSAWRTSRAATCLIYLEHAVIVDVDFANPAKIREKTDKLECSEQELAEAIDQVGPYPAAVALTLGRLEVVM